MEAFSHYSLKREVYFMVYEDVRWYRGFRKIKEDITSFENHTSFLMDFILLKELEES